MIEATKVPGKSDSMRRPEAKAGRQRDAGTQKGGGEERRGSCDHMNPFRRQMQMKRSFAPSGGVSKRPLFTLLLLQWGLLRACPHEKVSLPS